MTTDSVMTSRTSTAASLQSRHRGLPQPSQLARRRRIEALIRLAAPALDAGPVRGRPRRRAIVGRNELGAGTGAAARVFRRPRATRVSAVTANPNRRSRTPRSSSPGRSATARAPAIAAIVGAVGLLVYYVAPADRCSRDMPKASGLEALVRAASPGSVGELPSLQTAFFEYLDTKTLAAR